MPIARLFHDAQRLHQHGRLAEAQQHYQQILDRQADFGPARLLLAVIQQQAGLVRDAIDNAQRAMRDIAQPDAGIWANYGVVMKNAGLFDEAEQAYRNALALDPGLPAIKANLASLYLTYNRLDDAEPLCLELTRVLEDPAPWLNLARIALARGKIRQADEYLARAEDIHPKHPDLAYLRAHARNQEHDYPAAFAELRRVLELQPAHADAWTLLQSLPSAVIELDHVERTAMRLLESGVQQVSLLAPVANLCRQNLLWRPLPGLERQLTSLLEQPLNKAPSINITFDLLGSNVPQRGHLRAASATWRELYGVLKPLPVRSLPPRQADALRRIRVGFLSSDLRSHAIGFLVVGLLESLPKGQIEWFAYNNSFSDASGSRERMRGSVERFINVAPLSNEELATRIRQDEIDILIDLNGMTRDTRASALAMRPAPIQLTWLGMPGTLGAGDAADYVIGDAWTTWAGNVDGFAEKIIQLPRSYQPNDHRRPDLQLAGRRADHGLPEQGVVFCCFNQHYKISPDTFALWCEILRQVEGAVLWLLQPKSEALAERLRTALQQAGIDPARLIFAGQKVQAEHIARISLADLVLDTLPYNAHTTCSDALRVGVPVLTLPGETFAARVAASILTTGQLAEWIVDTEAAYVERAVAFARQPRAAIERIKQGVLKTYWQSPMVDNALFARQFETLCLGLYDRHAAGLPVDHLRLTESGQLVGLELEGATVDSLRQASAAEPFKTATAQIRSAASPVAEASAVNETMLGQQPARTRLDNLRELQGGVLGLQQPPLLVDIGAAALDSRAGFETLADHGLVKLLGFEPSPDSYQKLLNEQRPHRHYEPLALGDGGEHVLHLCTEAGMNSLRVPDSQTLDMFPMFARWGEVQQTEALQTHRLDDVAGARDMAMLKCDTQGSELMILQNAQAWLQRAVLLQLELSPTPLYHGEASLFETGHWLEQQGWVLHTLSNINRRLLKPFGKDEDPYRGLQHVFQVDAVFIPDLRHWDRLSSIQLQELAFLAHAMYQSHDLSMRALWTLDQREGTRRAEAYAAYLQETGPDA